MTSATHDEHSTSLHRRAAPRSARLLDRSWGSGFTAVHLRQLGALVAAVGLLVSVTASTAGAAPFGNRAVSGRVVRGFQSGTFDGRATRFAPSVHHRWHRLPPPPPPTTAPPPTTTTTQPPPAPAWPVGVTDATEPSGMAPPGPDAISGYTQSYVSDFTGSSLPSGWEVFTGQPGSDPGAQWAASHVTVGGGMLQLNTWKDPAYGNSWVAGGLCQCGVAQTSGAYFVRSRVTGAGPTQVQLLWPADNDWPPEIDFNESDGTTGKTSATVHFTAANLQDQRKLSGIDLTQWHTWGVIWTPSSITYTLDGQVWGVVSVSSEVPDVPMTLDLTQQTWCSSGWACPSSPQSMQVDWVAEYQAT